MAQKQNKLSRFWQELKRRRVIHVVTVYASASFVIIDLVGNLKEPLNLPPLLPTILIIILAVGFPLAVILSWIYGLTSEGVEKTKPLDGIHDDQKRTIPNAWKIATIASFVVIIGLVTYNIAAGTRGLRPGDIQSLAILPFDNFTGDEQLDWVADAMHSSLIGDMGRKASGLRVLGKMTSKAYKEKNMTATEIAERDHVEALVEPTLTCYGDMVCIQVRAITTFPEEKQLWAEDYMVDKSQILNLWNQIIKNVANELKVNLTPQEETLLADTKIIDPEAYDAYLGGRYMLDQANTQSLPAAIDSFKKAVEIESEWGAPYAGLAEAGAMKNHFELGSASDNLPMTYENLNKALELDPNSVEAHYTKALTAFEIEFDWKKAEQEFLTAIDLNPSHVRSHGFYADMLSKLRRTDKALYHGKKSEELDPENPFTLTIYVYVLLMNGKCQEALYYLEKGLSIDPDHPIFPLTGIYECLGEYDKAFEAWKGRVYPLWNEYGVAESFEKAFREHGWIAFIEELIRADEEVWKKDGHMHLWSQAGRYVTVGKYEKAMDIYETFYNNNNHYTRLPELSAKSVYEKMKGNQRYLALLEKLNLPTSDD